MIMPRGSDQLLLPASPVFIALSLLLALCFNLLPLGRQPAMPDLLALVLVFWNVHQPRRVGVGVAFLFGLLMDVHEGALLGQHEHVAGLEVAVHDAAGVGVGERVEQLGDDAVQLLPAQAPD
jgi:rod shape-determining protein MreD